MIKRAAGMVAASALLCGAIAITTSNGMIPINTSSQEAPVILELKPDTEGISYTTKQPIGILRVGGLQDTFTPATDYGQIFPCAVNIVGWDEQGMPIYRYALADSSGEWITNPVYTSVERMSCQGKLIWVLHERTQNGSERVSCVGQNGSWQLGPFDGTITIEDNCIFVRKTDNNVTMVFNSKGKIVGQVPGTVTSCNDGIIISCEGAEKNTWHISNASSAKKLATVTAKHVGRFSSGNATVQISDTQWGFVDKNGTITTTTATWIDECYDGYALAKNGNLFGIIDVSGNVVGTYEYVKGTHCSDELPIYQLWKNKEECMVFHAPSKQKLMLPKDLHAQPLVALPENHFAYIDENNKTVIFDDLENMELEDKATFYQQEDFVIAVMENGYQLFDLDDNKIGKLHTYQYVVPQQPAAQEDSVFTVTNPETGLQGIANTSGKIVLDAEYDSIFSIDGSYFAAVQNSWSGIVDSNGEWIVRTLLTGVN